MLDCNLCTQNGWLGPACPSCPNYQQYHYLEGSGAATNADYYCVAETPAIPGVSGSLTTHSSWSADIERVIKEAFTRNTRYRKEMAVLQGRFTYAVRCAMEKPGVAVRKACAELFHPELMKSCHPHQPLMLFALGPAVLQSLGFKVSGYKKVQGRLLDRIFQGKRVVVMPSLSIRQLLANPEHFELLEDHLRAFLEAVLAAKERRPIPTVRPTTELAKNYIFPTTIQQVRKLVDHVLNYTDKEGKDPSRHLLAFDTETNTLFPHLKKLKLLTLVFSWGPGLAASIPVEHDESPFTLEEVAPYIQLLLSSPQPKAMHNAKFDLKVLHRKGWEVNNLMWDTMLGEHLLAEAKKGYYGLKPMTQAYLPDYGGYEDELQELFHHKQTQKREEAGPRDPDAPKLKGAAKRVAEDDGYAIVPLKVLNVYGAIDADVTRQIALLQRKRMVAEQESLNLRRKQLGTNAYFKRLAVPGTPATEPLKELMFRHVIPVTRTITRMEETGMRVDNEYVQQLADRMDRSMRLHKIDLLQMIPPHALGNKPFNPDSTPQLRRLLFNTGYLHPVTRQVVCYTGTIPDDQMSYTDKGAISTDAKFLRFLKNQYDCKFSDALLKYRALAKARNTFIENILVLSAEDGRLHTTFHVGGTATGRLSSSDPNLQNTPKKIGEHNIKQCFIPTDPDTQVIMNADAKAAEVRLYAAYSRDTNLIEALNANLDPHSFFSSRVLNPANILQNVSSSERAQVLATVGIDDRHAWSYEDFQKRGYYIGTETEPGPDVAYGQRLDKLRGNIKRVVFGILYGAAPKKIAGIVGIPEEQASAIIDSLFKMFPTIPEYINQTKEKIRYLGVVETFFGRRRRFNFQGMTFRMRNKAERQAVNMLIQSTSSEIVLKVLTSMDDPIRHEFGGNLLITVHDSVVAEVPKKYVSQLPDFVHDYGVKRVREQCDWLPVPFNWDVEVGPSYGQVVDVSKYLAGLHTEETHEDDEYLEGEIKSDFEKLTL